MTSRNRNAYLSPLGVIALSFGYAVGWGSFVLPGTMFLPNAGPAGTIIGFALGTLALVVLAYNYHKVINHIHGSGGAYVFVTKIFGHNHSFLVGWFLFVTYMAIMWANATALAPLTHTLFGDAWQFGFHYRVIGGDVYFGEALLSLTAIVLCGGACLVGKRFAIRLHTFFAAVLFVGVAVCFTAALLKHQGGTATMGPAFSDGSKWIQIIRIFAMTPWVFVGFEAVIHSSPEFKFPVKRIFALLLAAIAISALVYMLLVLLPVLLQPEGYSNWKEYLDALWRLKGKGIIGMPVFLAAKKALGPWGVVAIGGAMLAGVLTALFATYIALSRLMCSMSDDGMLPAWFGRRGRDDNPANAILALMCLSLPIPFLGRTVLNWPVDLSNFGICLAYGYTSAAVLAIIKKEGGKPIEKAAGVFGLAMSIIFCLLLMVPKYFSSSSLWTGSYLFLSIWCFVGFLFYRRLFIKDDQGRFGNSVVVWVAVLIVIFFSSLMWFRLAVGHSAEYVFNEYIGKTVTRDIAQRSIAHVNNDMLFKTSIELCILIASLAIILNLFSILHRRERKQIVERLKAEESANQSKSYFFSTISHDIRTPLNAIIGYSQMLEMGFKREEDREQALRSIIDGSRSLLRLVNDMIDFARLEDGRMEFEPKPTDCGRLLRDFADFFREAKQIQAIELRSRAETMPTLLIDPKRIRQMLFCLTDNAAKFTRKGFVEVRASFDRASGADTGTLRLEVEDTGIGISGEDLKRITSPYVRVEAKSSRHGGTGIGLALCRKLTDAMGGELSIASALGKGSTFTVTLRNVKVTDAAPVEDRDPLAELLVTVKPKARSMEPAPAPAAPEAKAPEAAASKRVLIADDQKVNLIVLKTMLKKLGPFEVVMAKDGKEALDLLTSADAPFDLVLTDMWMPVMDGEGLVRAVRANAKLAELPVHVVTADTEMPGKYREIGFDGIILKPVTVEKLKEIVDS